MQARQPRVTDEQKPEVRPSRENAGQFDDVLSRYLPAFHRRALRHLGNTADAEDAVQDALLSAYKHLDQFRGGAQMSTWLTTIVINSARMQLRKRSSHIQVSLDEPLDDEQHNFLAERIADESPSPEDVCREWELHERVRELLTQLSAPLRKAFQLRDLDGLTTHEAALLLGVPDGTVKAQLTRARAKLRKLMRGSLDEKSSSAPLRTPVPIVTIKAKGPRPHLTSTARDQDRSALTQRTVLSGQIPAIIEAGRKVA
jgi:RNA polymerase sigma-70 factor (ECF subfamily)